jgi:choline-sulfatase
MSAAPATPAEPRADVAARPRLRSRAVAGLARATTRAALAAWLMGGLEAIRLLRIEASPGVGVITLGVTMLGAFTVALAAHGLGSAVTKIPVIRRWSARVATPGAERIEAFVALGASVKVLAGTWLATMAAATWALGRFKAPMAAGILVASASLAALLVLGALAATLAPPLGRALGRRAALQRATTGRAGALLAIAIAGMLLGGTAVGLTIAAPGFDFLPAFFLAGTLIAVGVAAVAAVERRLPRPVRVALPGSVVALVAWALITIGGDDVARTVIAGRGAASAAVMDGLWRLGDSDGDGYARWLGGGDCDDHDRKRSPAALEIVDNGIDDNCAGGDVTKADLAPRLRAVPSAQPDAPRRSVVLITIDTLRADHVGAYGYPRATSPTLDGLAARGARFEHASTPSPITRRAVPAIMTGRYASTLAFVPESWPPKLIAGRHVTLGQSFLAGGYQTFAALCCDDLFDRKSGVTEGITSVDDSAAKVNSKPGDKVIDAAIRQLRERDRARPLFQWIHLFEPHEPYVRHPGTTSFGTAGIDKYDGEIAFADAQVGRLLAAIAADPDLAATTIVAVTADHGEQFEEHGQRNHGKSLYAEELRVPLIIAVPGLAPTVIGTPVSTIDLGATLLDLVGLERPAGQNARSHAAEVRGLPPTDGARPVLAELIRDRQIGRSLRAVIVGRHKLIWDPRASTYELFDLVRDPADAHNLASRAPAELVSLKQALVRASDLELTLLPGEADGKAVGRAKKTPKAPASASPAPPAPDAGSASVPATTPPTR